MKTKANITLLISFSKGTLVVALLFFMTIPVFSQIGLNVKKYGAKGNGINNDTKAIQQAIDEAKKRNTNVYLPAGTYMVTNLSIQSSMSGEKNTIIKKISNADEKYTFCNIRNQRSLMIKDIIFDGNVKLDAKKEPVRGAIPLFIFTSNNIEVLNCAFNNSAMSGIRIEGSQFIKLSNCTQTNSYGVFGDGYYIDSSNNIDIKSCKANNYTRIGFVTDRDTKNVNFLNCIATNGSNASILKGGTESNAGFWFELSAYITATNCIAKNNIHYGFVVTSGISKEKINNAAFVSFNLNGCSSTNSAVGFKLTSAGNAVNTRLHNCQANQVMTGFVAASNDVNDRFYFTNCSASLLPSTSGSVNDAGFMWESKSNVNAGQMPLFSYTNCYIKYIEPVSLKKLFDRNTNNADLSTYGGGTARILIDNMKNSLPNSGPVIKAIKGNPFIEIKNTKADLRFMVKGQNVKIQ
ncbi:glycosyl hydrolase family 28-related protein [Pedobacter nyackensis]|uniref:Pectate lyase superfamily protein n=1 Tax=Pedobacter nyackensis TaxID=475255 RepID=A0A1W2C213_9SPHI|nr:glycosyl hydrolase family 28-related protein [Pedobacter nyackensis]SMC79190.1 Pectate lyase superfamily protein [Pedobacter nyackensis]